MSGAFRSTLQQLRSKAWVLHEPPGAFLELLILGCAHSSLNFCFSLALASFDFVLHVPPRSPCESPRWRFLAVAGVAEEAQSRQRAQPLSELPWQEGLGAAPGAFSRDFLPPAPLPRCHFGPGAASGGARSPFWSSSTSRASLIP